ncbi:MAG: hypothetical protein U0989_13800 [Azonexus sp.]|nr:hypothetical protein [Azonexus sp.]MDZ4315826.1 hypothetical protein [Azonexus sp.]
MSISRATWRFVTGEAKKSVFIIQGKTRMASHVSLKEDFFTAIAGEKSSLPGGAGEKHEISAGQPAGPGGN